MRRLQLRSAAAVTARWAAAVTVAGLFLAGSTVLASMHGWSVTPEGFHRLAENPQVLLFSIALGVLGILAALVILGRRPWSPWLLLGVIPAAFYGSLSTGFPWW